MDACIPDIYGNKCTTRHVISVIYIVDMEATRDGGYDRTHAQYLTHERVYVRERRAIGERREAAATDHPVDFLLCACLNLGVQRHKEKESVDCRYGLRGCVER
jgi:hypothetical protein